MSVYKVSIPGYSHLVGSPEQIVRLMNDAQFFEAMKSEDAYMDRTRDNVKKLFDKRILFTGDTVADRAESFLKSLEKNGLIEIEIEKE